MLYQYYTRKANTAPAGICLQIPILSIFRDESYGTLLTKFSLSPS